jgi:eukaryotic translation initiation factor 2C
MIKNACKPPRENAETIVYNGLPSLGLTKHTSLIDAFGISIDPQMAVVPGRVLDPPRVAYPNCTLEVQNGSWNLIKVKFQRGARVGSWWVMHVQIRGETPQVDVHDLADRFKNKAKESGIILTDAKPFFLPVEIPSQRSDNKSRSKALTIIRNKLKERLDKGPRPSFILVLMEKKDDTIYSGIKVTIDVAFILVVY